MRRRVVCPRSHPASLYARASLGPRRGLAVFSRGDTPGPPGRPMLGPLWALAGGSQYFPGGHPRTPGSLYARASLGPRRGLAVLSRGDTPGPPGRSMLGPFWPSPGARSIFPGDTRGPPGRPMLTPFRAFAGGSGAFLGGYPPGPRTTWAPHASRSRVLGVFPVGATPDLCGAKRYGEALGVLWRCECFALVFGEVARGAGRGTRSLTWVVIMDLAVDHCADLRVCRLPWMNLCTNRCSSRAGRTPWRSRRAWSSSCGSRSAPTPRPVARRRRT